MASLSKCVIVMHLFRRFSKSDLHTNITEVKIVKRGIII